MVTARALDVLCATSTSQIETGPTLRKRFHEVVIDTQMSSDPEFWSHDLSTCNYSGYVRPHMIMCHGLLLLVTSVPATSTPGRSLCKTHLLCSAIQILHEECVGYQACYIMWGDISQFSLSYMQCLGGRSRYLNTIIKLLVRFGEWSVILKFPEIVYRFSNWGGHLCYSPG